MLLGGADGGGGRGEEGSVSGVGVSSQQIGVFFKSVHKAQRTVCAIFEQLLPG